MVSKAQEKFDKEYISSSEICETLDISRSALTAARRRGVLPEPILLKGSLVFIWERNEVNENLKKWQFNLQARRGELLS
jgi:hypothetical protein